MLCSINLNHLDGWSAFIREEATMEKNVLRRIGTAGFVPGPRDLEPFSGEESEALHGHLPLHPRTEESI